MTKSELIYEKKTVYEKAGKEVTQAAFAYAEGYKHYLDAGKTEREALKESIAMAEACGYQEYRLGDPIQAGDRLYYNNRGRNLFVFSVGSEPIQNGIRITVAHIDAPRIDLKQCPLYEDGGMAFFKTHYYGGIRKYQWVATPLSLHGVVATKDGRLLDITIGEDEADPLFYINDLLPHLGQEQSKKPLSEGITGEQLNVLVGSMPDEEEKSVTLHILQLLNEKYGITEDDFLSSELCVVPAAKARDVGLDRSMIGAYGHDDRVCAYPILTALLDDEDTTHTKLCILADKEETGSDGPGGMQSDLILDIINEIATALGGNPAVVRANSKCLSADVSAAYDPNFPEVFEKRNTPLLSCGAVFTKFTGSRGKSGTNDATAEYIGWLRGVLSHDDVVWQAGELGKVDCGGGGTVAKYVSMHNIDTIDLGVPVISMHAPWEVIAKVDLYETYRAARAFYKY
ncbi:MAG: aminopeptidase [Ruminococcaceae bacterium]|nr:aminopeptidase [Oscillospiraceae bacterium]